jgi:hypothetical protein
MDSDALAAYDVAWWNNSVCGVYSRGFPCELLLGLSLWSLLAPEASATRQSGGLWSLLAL